MKIWNATIHTMTDRGVIENGYVCIEDGKITAVESGRPAELAPEDIDAAGSLLLPGFIDAHTHLGIIENGIAFEGDDCNEATDPFTPHLRVIDGVNPLDRCFQEAREAGVTTVMTSPGSANTCGGAMAILKTAGRMVDRMCIGTGMKFALGENPKSVYNDRDETPITRMATAAIIREGLAKAQRYQQELDFAESDPDEHMPDYDAKSEALLPLLERDVKAHFHCHRADDICTAIRIAKEFNLDYVIVHGTEGYEIADILAEEEAPVIVGPTLCDRCKPEMQNLNLQNPKILQENGVQIALTIRSSLSSTFPPLLRSPSRAVCPVRMRFVPSLPALLRFSALPIGWAALLPVWMPTSSCTTATRWIFSVTRGWCSSTETQS